MSQTIDEPELIFLMAFASWFRTDASVNTVDLIDVLKLGCWMQIRQETVNPFDIQLKNPAFLEQSTKTMGV
ncbi:hypothetical protein M3Y97_01026100 [Aphelenchoides bicaudatus]|nr:hypothetical protein M3Y97_01026100 [Aphelenchoides bicaudatus]